MSIDNTHTKYLKGADKKAWNNYKDAYEATKKLENFMDGFNVPDLKDGEEFDIPVHKQQGNKKKETNNKE